MLRSAACVAAIALVTAGGASAEVVARSVQDGFLALDAKGVPSVAWVRNSTLFVAERPAAHRWTPNGGRIGSAGIERGGVRDRRRRARRARPERRRPHDRARPPALGGLADDPGREGRRALPARLARPRARWEGPRGARLHALECPDAEEPAARLARRREGPHHDAPDHPGRLPEEPRAAARGAPALRRRRTRGRVVRLPRRARHDRVVPFEEDVDRARARRGARRLPGRAGLRRSQPERGHARGLDGVAALVRPRGGARDAGRAAALRELPVRARPRADERAGATGDRPRGRGEPVDQRERPRASTAIRTSGPGRSSVAGARSSSTAGSPAMRSRRAAGATCCWAGRRGCAGSTCPGGSRRASRSRRRTTASR